MSEWISVKDRLPKHEGPVMVTTGNWGDKPDVCAARLWTNKDGSNPKWCDYYGSDVESMMGASVTHWMPLPKPPELSEHETTTFKPIATDARGYACQFSCSACDCTVSMAYYMRPDQFDYNYCPYCGRPVESEDDAE